MDDKINRALTYYKERQEEIIDFINRSNNLDVNIIISRGEELNSISAKISALELANNN